MNTCDSWEHGLLVWDGYSNELCPLCRALKSEDVLDRKLERLTTALDEITAERDMLRREQMLRVS